MPPAAPKTALAKVLSAVRALADHKGSSRQAISKYCRAEFGLDSAAAMKKALKKGVADGVLEQRGQSFKVKGEEYEEPADERLGVADRAVGEGEEAVDGAEVTVAYVGKLDSGYTFDKASDFSFLLGNKDVIKGWDRGVRGMRVGGVRELVCPPKLGYGQKGCSPDIPPGATLNFVVTLKGVK
ncbi:hypothetical protein TeGR_g10440 [Tetraparma gracilis]|uniref:peptidylprolyl isomerase n=1 Tax=Tetraparma gracilis TaxID=2962635 RepID=A0ABQ6M7V0_9STRA|nr:hypothetical protein TeGR_g10440 [Tetraparma gracilis]